MHQYLKIGLIAVAAMFVVRTLANRTASIPVVGQITQIAANGL